MLKISLPKVKFIETSIELETHMIYSFLFKFEWGWGNIIIKRHPKLKPVYKIRKGKEKKEFIKKYIIRFRTLNQKRIFAQKEEIEKAWRKIEKEYMLTLTEIINIEWPSRGKKIKAMISINPICPRFLDDWSFSLSFRYDIKGAMPIIMHEICHFLYFEKWKRLFPKSKRRTWDYPYIEWHLSEVVAPIILNDKRIQSLLKQKASFYREHRGVKIKGISSPKYFSKLYTDYVKKNKKFDDFIKEAYRVIKRNKKIFLNIGK